MNTHTSTQSMKPTLIPNENGINARCGRRGCKVVELPFDGSISSICGITQRRVVSIYRLSDRGTPTWEVVRWDIDEPASLLSKTAW
jgi:hypothetical protein